MKRWAASLICVALASISTWAVAAARHPGKPVHPQEIGAHCATASGCASGFCVDGLCCNKACNGSCQICAASKGAPVDGLCSISPAAPPGECAPYACQGLTCPTSCDSDVQCQPGGHCGPDHACRSRQPNGTQCADNEACASGFCADGVCCSSACSGACDVCSADLGAEQDGICTLVSGDGSPSCAPYVCDGLSAACPAACASAAQCVEGDVCAQGRCQPKGVLGASCGADVDCVEGRCSDGRCVARPRASGGACSADSQCRSGFCSDGVCCDTACSGGCDRCDLPGAFGRCRLEKAGTPGAPACTPYLCSGSVAACPTSCTSDKGCVAGDACVEHQCVPKAGNGTDCGRDAQCASGFCVDGLCCDRACDGDCESCGATGTCAPLPARTAASACGGYLCGGVGGDCPTACADDTACASGDFCVAGKCVKKSALGVSCDRDAQCVSGLCIDGVCCDGACDGSCNACNVAGSVGRCRPARAGSPGDPTCGAFVCDGHAANCPISCTADRGCAAGYACTNGQCVAKDGNGTACTRDDTCASGFCVDGLCCDSACDGDCEACTVAGGAKADGTCTPFAAGTTEKSCGAFVCDGAQGDCPTACTADTQCVDGDFCDHGRCASKRSVGASCDSVSGCKTGFCIDGVCCATACDGQCAACNVPGKRGQCAPTKGKPVGDRPTCGDDRSRCEGHCDGRNVDACVYPPSAQPCAPAGCDDGVAHGLASCDGVGHCASPETTPCSPYACGDATCQTSCDGDDDCASGFWCQNGACIPKQSNGVACSDGRVCSSGNCEDGVCCDTTCDGPCDRCDLPGHAGLCSVAPSGAAPHPDTCGRYRCDGESVACPDRCANPAECAAGFTCEKGRCVARRPDAAACRRGDQCESSHCVEGICCDSACEGLCATCTATDHTGTCMFVSGTSETDRGHCLGSGQCGGVCDGSGPECRYPSAHMQCGEAVCSGAVATDAALCDGRGTCVQGATRDCPTGCDGKRCGADALRTDDTGCAQVPAGWAAIGLLLPLLLRRRRRA